MEGKGSLTGPKSSSNGMASVLPSGYALFDLSGSPVASFPLDFHSEVKVLGDDDDGCLELIQRRTKVGRPTNVSEGESDTKSDAGTYGLWESEGGYGSAEEEEEEEGEDFYRESVKQKMEMLAGMVGIEGCVEPAVVLANVVRVLRELDRRRDLVPGFRRA